MYHLTTEMEALTQGEGMPRALSALTAFLDKPPSVVGSECSCCESSLKRRYSCSGCADVFIDRVLPGALEGHSDEEHAAIRNEMMVIVRAVSISRFSIVEWFDLGWKIQADLDQVV